MYFLALPSLLHPLISLLFILVHDVLLFLSSNQFLHAMYKTLGALYGTSYTFQCCTQKSGWRVRGEATLTLRAGDEANILAQQCCSRLNGSQQQQPWCIVLSNSALQYWHQINLHSSYPQILGDISLLQTSANLGTRLKYTEQYTCLVLSLQIAHWIQALYACMLSQLWA